MKLNDAIAFALALPGAFEDHPWGETVAKVGKKVFVFFGERGMSVKLPHSHEGVLLLPGSSPTGYGLGKAGWVSLEDVSQWDREMIEEWMVESYRAVAPKTQLRELDQAAQGDARRDATGKAQPTRAAKPVPKPKAAAKAATPRASTTKPTVKPAAKRSASAASSRPTPKPKARRTTKPT